MRSKFAWRDGNSIDLYVDGDRFFPEMLDAIHGARRSVFLEMYLVASGAVLDRFIAALMDAATRGVRVCVLFDHYGARWFRSEDVKRLKSAAVELVFYNPVSFYKWSRNFARDHRKLLIVDHQYAFIGGTGLTDEYWIDLPSRPDTPWHELMCRVEGPIVADLADLFARLWNRTRRTESSLLRHLPPREHSGSARIRLLTSEGPARQHIKFSVLRSTREAHQRVWICTAYFLPSFSLRLALRRAARKGLDVRLLVAGPLTDHRWIYYASKRYYRRLLNAGVRIYEYQPRMLHSKVALFDDLVSLGSCNLDHWNLRWNLEANIEVHEPAFAREVEELLSIDFADSCEIDAQQWARRPWYRKLREAAWALVCQWILRIR
ncbi:phospholipase D-like domain-containing protein [Marinobacterium sp. YM272]|uniref:phospholipase D-like domain-containing protein n=1 Tax=Marinobacterium sp. YM272 TaxID=3421654 RepID=UPI003D7FB21C